jgi:hypothetical protein
MADSTVNVCMNNYILTYSFHQTDAYFVFSCIGNDLSYSSSEVITSPINYPNQCMNPIGTISSTSVGSSS